MVSQEKKRMPLLVVDEVLLLVDSYFEIKKAFDVAEKKKLIAQLSENMRSLPFFKEETNSPEFRSYAGMQMCLANVGYVNPENNSKFGHGSALQKRIFNSYVNRQMELHKLALAIVSIAKEEFPIDYSFASSDIGMLVPSYHVYLERTNKSVLAVKKQLEINMDTVCKVCNRDMSDIYADGNKLIEIHLDLPIYLNCKDSIISPSEMIGVCPSCHKLAHMEYDSFEVSKLRKHLKK